MPANSVYWIHHKDHTDMFSQGYIGVSQDAKKRWEQHFKRSENTYLRNAINKYGWDNLVKEIVLIGDKDYCFDIEKKLRPFVSIGWNIVEGGGNPPRSKKGMNLGRTAWNKGGFLSEETKKQISNKVAELWKSQEYRDRTIEGNKGRGSSFKGKNHSSESIEKIRLAKLGKPSPKKGRKVKPESLEKIKATFLANKWLCPHCQKEGLGKHTATRWHFNNCKKKS
jgi:group I intron endonuclease